MNNALKIIITAISIIAANIAIHFWPQWTDQIFMCWLVAVLLTVTWERQAPDYHDDYVEAVEDGAGWKLRAFNAEAENYALKTRVAQLENQQ